MDETVSAYRFKEVLEQLESFKEANRKLSDKIDDHDPL